MLDFTLTAEQEALRDKAREFAFTEVLPVAWEYDARDETPLFILERAFAAGLMNGDIPARCGGQGLGIVEACLMTEEIAAACPGLATSIFDNSLGLEPLLLSDNTALQDAYLPRLLEQFRLICFATSEPGMGSDVSAIRCRAEERGDHWVLNGTKFWITNGGLADYITVFATVDPQKRHEGICAFLVERDWPGVRAGRPIPKLGQRCSNTAGLHFDNVRVPAANLIAPPGEGFALAMKTFARTRPVIGAFAVGAARSAMELAVEYAKQRRAFGAAIGGFQAIQFKLAEMFQQVETARLLTWKAAWEADQGRDPTVSASIAKFYATEIALEVVNEALQIFGGYGYTRFFPLEKLLRDTRLFRIYEGTSEIQRMIVAGHVMHAYTPALPPLAELPLHGRRPEAAEPDAPAWRCRVCGHVHYGDAAPEACPYCFMPAAAFDRLAPEV